MNRQHDPGSIHRFGFADFTATVANEVHHLANIIGGTNDGAIEERLFDVINGGGIRKVHRVVDNHLVAIGHVYFIDHTRVGGNDVDFVLTTQAFLNNFHVQQPQEPAAEPEAQCHRTLRSKGEGRIIQRQLFETVFELFVLRSIHRINATEHHGVHFLKTGKSFFGHLIFATDRVANPHIRTLFDVGNHIAGFPGLQTIQFLHRRRENAHFLDLEIFVVGEQVNLVLVG